MILCGHNELICKEMRAWCLVPKAKLLAMGYLIRESYAVHLRYTTILLRNSLVTSIGKNASIISLFS